MRDKGGYPFDNALIGVVAVVPCGEDGGTDIGEYCVDVEDKCGGLEA